MPVYKRTYSSGKVVWCYVFSGPGATREHQNQITASGFPSKKAAQQAEAERRTDEKQKYDEEQKKRELEKAGSGIASDNELPKTLIELLEAFLKQHASEKLAPKTIERYRDAVTYLHGELLSKPFQELTSLHFSSEWTRLLKSGGHTRKSHTPRPLSGKTVRNIASVVSSAYHRAIKWGLTKVNPVTDSEPPKPETRRAAALTATQQETLFNAASGPWCLQAFWEIDAAMGCRRGEVLALRWSDVVGKVAFVTRSLSQTHRIVDGKRVHDVLIFKTTKTNRERSVTLPDSALAVLEAHRREQYRFREQYGPDYRADLDLIFANPDGTPLKPDSISAAVSALFKRLKIPKPKGSALHLLRHSHVSVLLAQGVPIPAISERVGHGDPQTTLRIYGHMIAGQDEEAARKWDEYQKKNRASTGPVADAKLQ